jgi:hypothetical protein
VVHRLAVALERYLRSQPVGLVLSSLAGPHADLEPHAHAPARRRGAQSGIGEGRPVPLYREEPFTLTLEERLRPL